MICEKPSTGYVASSQMSESLVKIMGSIDVPMGRQLIHIRISGNIPLSMVQALDLMSEIRQSAEEIISRRSGK